MANWVEIIGGGAVIGLAGTFGTEIIKTWLARRNRLDEGKEKSVSLAIEKQKAEDEYDTKLIAALMDERKELHVRIKALEEQVEKERLFCEDRMKAMRAEYQSQIAELRAEIRELQKERKS